MQIPDYLHQQVAEVIGVQFDAAMTALEAHKRQSYWAVVLGLTPYRDGDQWCLLWGKDMVDGVVGFGKTPELAIQAFEKAMGEEAGRAKT